MKNSKSSKSKVQKGQWHASCHLFPKTPRKRTNRRCVNHYNRLGPSGQLEESYPRTTGLPENVLEHTLINCPLSEFYNYIDNFEDYFQMARVLAKQGKLAGLRHAYINNEVYDLALEKILG